MSKKNDLQKVTRAYKDATGEREIDMHKVAEWAVTTLGWTLPKPVKPIDLLAKQLADAAREEIRHDKTTGLPYRVNHAIVQKMGRGQTHLWIDIDEAPREQMHASLINRREQMVGDGLQITLDAGHWNSIHPTEDPIKIPMDFTFDIELRKNVPD